MTLCGPPGVGKSRLALEVARSLERDFRGDAWHVGLAGARGAADVVGLVARAVDVRGANPLAQVVARFRDSDAILVFDACEHVLEEAVRVMEALLTGCPGVRLLATSRQVLHVPGEVRVAVEPLACRRRDRETPSASRPSSSSRRVRRRAGVRADGRKRLARCRDQPSRRRPAARDRARRRAGQCPRPRGAHALVTHRLELLGERPTSDPGRAAPGRSSSGATTSCMGTRRPAPPRCGAPGRCSSPRTRRCARRPRAGRGDGDPAPRHARRQVHRHRLVPERGRTLRRARHGARVCAPSAWPRAAASRLPGKRTRSTTRQWRTPREVTSRARMAILDRAARARARQPLGRARTLTRGPTRISRADWGRSPGTSRSRSASPRRRFVDSRSRPSARMLRLRSDSELTAFFCYLATEELDLEAAVEAGERGLGSTEPSPQSLAEALSCSPLPGRAPSSGRSSWPRGRRRASRQPRKAWRSSRRPACCTARSPL